MINIFIFLTGVTMETEPRGNLSLRTVAMPADTNPNGDIFGGWLVSQMDLAAFTCAKKTSYSRVATVGIESINFIQPVAVGDVVCLYTELLRIGRTSMRIRVQVWKIAHKSQDEQRVKVTEGVFTFVAIDKEGNKRLIKKE